MRPERGRRETAATWVGKVVEDKATLQSLLESCLQNVIDAAHEERDYRALYARLPAGDPRIVGTKDELPMGVKIRIAVADQKHWRECVAYYRARVEREGGDTMIRIKFTTSQDRRAPPPARPEREPGIEG